MVDNDRLDILLGNNPQGYIFVDVVERYLNEETE
jgi:hypothetical protein